MRRMQIFGESDQKPSSWNSVAYGSSLTTLHAPAALELRNQGNSILLEELAAMVF